MKKKELRTYGHDKTIHGTNHVDVELSEDGHVVSVWFRCQPLRFEYRTVSENRAKEMRKQYKEHKAPKVHAIVVED